VEAAVAQGSMHDIPQLLENHRIAVNAAVEHGHMTADDVASSCEVMQRLLLTCRMERAHLSTRLGSASAARHYAEHHAASHTTWHSEG
jgi:hypothetical protein